jgi:hypothetical protein
MKAPAMKFLFAATLVLTCTAFSAATALEMTATTRDVKEANPEITVTAQNALISAAITKVNKDVLAILRCNKKNMFYKLGDSTADTDGCVGATISTSSVTKTVNLPTVTFDSYPGYSKNSKGFIGSSYRYIDLSALVADGATAISITGTRGGGGSDAWGSCGGSMIINIANVNTSYATTTKDCHYDSSPNRHHYFDWSYNAATKKVEVVSRLSQTSMLRTKAQITGMAAAYTVTKTVLKVGDGK